MRRTAATVKTGYEFGRASRLGKEIRMIVSPINPCRDDRRVMFRLTGALNLMIHRLDENPSAQTVRSALGYLSHFQFNKEGAYSCMERIEIEPKLVGNRITGFRFPSFSPKQYFSSVPAGTTKIFFRVRVLAVSARRSAARLLGKADWEIAYSDENFHPEDMDFNALAEPGELMLTVAAVEYETSRKGLINIDQRMNFRPCGIIRTEAVL
ncbi:MAG TPA: hypothetical protein VG890_14535 [Puia sp.]|nr:hypothetical protein [Puia sp.]